MGGYGSGRWQRGKRTTADALRLDIRRLHQEGLLMPGNTFSRQWTYRGKRIAAVQVHVRENCIILSYRTSKGGGEWQHFEYPISLDWTAVHFGGRRVWCLCPECGRRVAILFGRTVFACRNCHKLVYLCQRQDAIRRAQGRMFRIQELLGWEDCYGFKKPKNMHRQTFFRLIERHNHFWQASEFEIAKKVQHRRLRFQRLMGSS